MRRGRPPGSPDRNGRAARSKRLPTSAPAFREFAKACGRRLRELREEQDIAASELAAAIKMSKMTVHSWERGREVPRIRVMISIAAALRCSLVDLLPEAAHYRSGT